MSPLKEKRAVKGKKNTILIFTVKKTIDKFVSVLAMRQDLWCVT